MNLAPKTRRYLYRIGIAGVALLAGYGILGDDKALLWVALLGPLLGLADRHVED